MFNMAFPVYCIIDVYSKKLNIGYGCDLFIVISNLDISYWFVFSCILDKMCFIKIDGK
jgi:hypothetical protein